MCREMQPPGQHPRINLADLKAQMVKTLGPESSKQYFYYLNRFLSLKMSKVEFNKLCLRLVGRENIPLHNQFIHSILKNACGAKTPPPTYKQEVLKSSNAVGSKELPADGHRQSGSYHATLPTPVPPTLSNGDILPVPHRKVRTGTCDQMVGDRRNAFGPNGKINVVSQPSLTGDKGNSDATLENGYLNLQYVRRPVEALNYQSANLSAIKGLRDGSASGHDEDLIGQVASEERKDVSAWRRLHAPFGVPLCPGSVGGARRTMPLGSNSNYVSLFDISGLLDSVALRERMEQIAAAQGLQGVSMDCANLLNKGLDAYLKGLVASCIQLVGARSGYEPTKVDLHKCQTPLRCINGVRPGNHPILSSIRPGEGMQEQKTNCLVSLQDFRVAMELNPQQLGEDWPLLLEKMCTHSFEE